ncbi:MAG: response regulator [candidate division Zixibacteria bacterium]|nr:response regulator [candidate division Zixibacteria bacterium]
MDTQATHTPRVLVVENNREVLSLVTTMVSSLNCNAMSAASIEEARQCLLDGSIDAIITDLVLGDGDGLELIRELRDRGDEVPALMISSYASPELRTTAQSAGAADLLAKPFRMERLSEALRRVLDDRSTVPMSTE